MIAPFPLLAYKYVFGISNTGFCVQTGFVHFLPQHYFSFANFLCVPA
jgi:hypothetical protein